MENTDLPNIDPAKQAEFNTRMAEMSNWLHKYSVSHNMDYRVLMVGALNGMLFFDAFMSGSKAEYKNALEDWFPKEGEKDPVGDLLKTDFSDKEPKED